MQQRKATFKLYPSAGQAEGLQRLLRAHKDLWNAALEERVDAWRKVRRSISYEDQCKALTQVRAELPDDWASMNCSSQQITLRRLDKAFKAFFARLARGQSPGFPRFKSLARMPGIGFKGHGDGWRFTPELAAGGRPDDFGTVRWRKHGTLRLQGIGQIRCRGQARAAGVIKSCELLHRHGQWHVSLTLECADADVARGRIAHHAMAADWGVKTLLTLARTDGARGEVIETLDNPRWYLESLALKYMTASARGTVESPGKNVGQKTGLNREILDTAPAALMLKLAYKVHETGGLWLQAPTAKLKPSQTCPVCGAQQKKALAERWHCCHRCGHEEDRDSAAARVVLRWALGTIEPGREPAREAA